MIIEKGWEHIQIKRFDSDFLILDETTVVWNMVHKDSGNRQAQQHGKYIEYILFNYHIIMLFFMISMFFESFVL